MSTLFDTELPVALASPETIRALVDQYGFDAVKVKSWSREKADTILRSRRLRDHQDANHGEAQAATEDEESDRTPNGREIVARLEAASFLGEAVEAEPNEVLLALIHAMHALALQEMRDFARLLILQFQRHPVSGEPLCDTVVIQAKLTVEVSQ